MLTFHAVGDWTPAQVHLAEVPSTYRSTPQVDALIDATWARAAATPGIRLFDGPMVRLESWDARPTSLSLSLSRTSYKVFLGTNLHHPSLADEHGREILANPVGVSPALETADGWLLFGRRNASVAYYPDRVHPFAGALEPRDAADVFAAVRRELHEELGLTAEEVTDIRCTGIAEDQSIRQPELIFRARVARTRAEIEANVDKTEHHASWAVRAEAGEIEAALADAAALTPVAVAALLLWGRVRFGNQWFTMSQAAVAG